jgi:hypothetical protein
MQGEAPSPEAKVPNSAPQEMIPPLSLCIGLACLLLGVALVVIPIAGTQGEAALTGVSSWDADAGAGILGFLAGLLIAFFSASSLVYLFIE